MTACPSHEIIVALLAERLPEPELDAIVAHIEDCVRCQTHLEDLTRGPGRISTVEDAAGDRESESSTAFADDGSAGDASPAAGNDGARDEYDPAVEATACLTSDDEEAKGGRTRPQIDLVPASHRAEPAGSQADFPVVAGYEVLDRLGHGGMGVVYKARDLGLNRLVALKMIRGGSQAKPEFFKRFSTEAEAIAKLRHPHIIQIYDIGEADALPYVALELLEGGGLDDRLAGTPQPGGDAAELLATLATAIQVAHDAGIIHRDLKPSNVIYTADGMPKITDFGLAKRIDSDDHQTQSGQIMGSPSYMAPEQAKGRSKEVGAAADVYALGAIFYEMLTGRPPFKGETPIETIRQVIDDEPVPPSRLAPRLAHDLETICLKCLHKDPARRYESSQALADDVNRYLRKEPIHARPTPPWERATKWARRRPLAAAASVVGTLLLLGGSAAGFVYERGLRIAEQAHNETVFAQQTTGSGLLAKADAARSPSELRKSLGDLSRFLSVIENELRLTALAGQIRDKTKSVGDQLDALQTEYSKRERIRADRERLQSFRKLRRTAQLYGERMWVIEPVAHQKAIRTTAMAALAVFGREPAPTAGAWGLSEPLPEALEPAQKDEVKAGCVDLLSILSDALEPAEGLKVLDCTLQLRPVPTAAYHLRKAALLFKSGDQAGREKEEELARSLPPTTALDHLLIGREQLARAQYRDAIHSARAAVRLDKEQLGAHLILAVARFKTERFGDAKASLNTCIETAPDLLGLYLMRAVVLGEEGNRALLKIKEEPSRAARWKLEATEYFAAAETDYSLAFERSPTLDLLYVLLINRGGMRLQAGYLNEAMADAQAAAKANGNAYHAQALLAQIYQQQGQVDQAAQALDRAVAQAPDRPELFRARALLVAHRREGDGTRAKSITAADRAAAIRDLQHAIQLEPADTPQKADDYAELGRLLFASGSTHDALTAYDIALRSAPENPKALRLRALALLEQERYDDVLAACDAYLARGKPSADLLELRGQARLARKDYSGAIGDYAVALSLDPDSPTLHNRRGWAYLLADASKLALADFDAALALDPDLSHAYSGRGLALVRDGRWRDAVADVETALRLATAGLKQQAYYNAARVYSLSLKFDAENVSRRGEAGLSEYRRRRDRAAALLLESVHQLPPDRQGPFWREVVASDPALRKFIP